MFGEEPSLHNHSLSFYAILLNFDQQELYETHIAVEKKCSNDRYYPCYRIYLVPCLNAPYDGSSKGLIEEVLEVQIGEEADAVIARCQQYYQANGIV